MNRRFKSIITDLGGVTAVSRLLRVSRTTVYKWIADNGVRYPASREILMARGFNPDTLKRI